MAGSRSPAAKEEPAGLKRRVHRASRYELRGPRLIGPYLVSVSGRRTRRWYSEWARPCAGFIQRCQGTTRCLGNGRLRIALPWTRRCQVVEKVEDFRAQSVAMMAAAARQAR